MCSNSHLARLPAKRHIIFYYKTLHPTGTQRHLLHTAIILLSVPTSMSPTRFVLMWLGGSGLEGSKQAG